jgi:hypothetical protein
VLDIDLGPRLVSFVLLFVALPILLAGAASAAIGRRIRNATTKLAIGMYMMLVCAFVTPAPIFWGDDHLGFPSTQALQGYATLFWAVGAIATLDSLSGVIRRRELLGVACGVIAAALLVCGWLGTIVGPAVGLALVPAAGTLAVLLALTLLARRDAGPAARVNWPWATRSSTASAAAMAVYVYLRGPQAFGPRASELDLVLLGILACVPVIVLAGWHSLASQSKAPADSD